MNTKQFIAAILLMTAFASTTWASVASVASALKASTLLTPSGDSISGTSAAQPCPFKDNKKISERSMADKTTIRSSDQQQKGRNGTRG